SKVAMRSPLQENRQSLQGARNAQRALPTAWRKEHRPSHARGVSAQPESELEARCLFCGSDRGPQEVSGGSSVAAPIGGSILARRSVTSASADYGHAASRGTQAVCGGPCGTTKPASRSPFVISEALRLTFTLCLQAPAGGFGPAGCRHITK